jgi:hypothetical protein
VVVYQPPVITRYKIVTEKYSSWATWQRQMQKNMAMKTVLDQNEMHYITLESIINN